LGKALEIKTKFLPSCLVKLSAEIALAISVITKKIQTGTKVKDWSLHSCELADTYL